MQQGEQQGGVLLLLEHGVALHELAQFLLGREAALEDPQARDAAEQHAGEGERETEGLGRPQADLRRSRKAEGAVVEVLEGIRHPLRHSPGCAIRQDQAQLHQGPKDPRIRQRSLPGQMLEGHERDAVQIGQGVREALVVLQVEDHGLQQPEAALGAIVPAHGNGQTPAFTNGTELLIRAVRQELKVRARHEHLEEGDPPVSHERRHSSCAKKRPAGSGRWVG